MKWLKDKHRLINMNSRKTLAAIPNDELRRHLQVSTTWTEFKVKCGLPQTRGQNALRRYLDGVDLDYSHLPVDGGKGMQSKSKLWSINTDEFKKFVAESGTWTELMVKCGYGDLGNISTARKRIKKLELNTDHLTKRPDPGEFNKETLQDYVNRSRSWTDLSRLTGFANRKKLSTRMSELGIKHDHISRKPTPLTADVALKEDTPLRKPTLRRLMITEKSVCAGCKLGTWHNLKIPLKIIHLNKNSRDNRPENLVLLCPNCMGSCKPTRILVIGDREVDDHSLPDYTLETDLKSMPVKTLEKTPYWVVRADDIGKVPARIKEIATKIINV